MSKVKYNLRFLNIFHIKQLQNIAIIHILMQSTPNRRHEITTVSRMQNLLLQHYSNCENKKSIPKFPGVFPTSITIQFMSTHFISADSGCMEWCKSRRLVCSVERSASLESIRRRRKALPAWTYVWVTENCLPVKYSFTGRPNTLKRKTNKHTYKQNTSPYSFASQKFNV